MTEKLFLRLRAALVALLACAARASDLALLNSQIWPALRGGGAPAGTFECNNVAECISSENCLFCKSGNQVVEMRFAQKDLQGKSNLKKKLKNNHK